MPSLYVHVPFCVRKCEYCAFYSVPLAPKASETNRLESAYFRGLQAEIPLRQQDAPLGVSSLFIGGGTPTALSDEGLSLLFTTLAQGFTFQAGAEKTVEVNPGTLSTEKLRVLQSGGINRISLGVQAFDDILLQKIGRIHTGAQVKTSVQLIRAAGFANLNLDLLMGLPDQSFQAWQQSIEQALELEPEHLSLYGLMFEEGTPLGDNYLARPKDLEVLEDQQADLYEWAVARLFKAGYHRYETSNFAKPGYECQHNLSYWQGQEYIGLGPSAVSYLHNQRWKNVANIAEYARLLAAGSEPLDKDGREQLSVRERMAERVILGLRLTEGVDLPAFRQEFGVDLYDIFGSVVERYQWPGILIKGTTRLTLNPSYAFVANSILQEFV